MLDHGVLNVPLAKRGGINAEIDRFKAEQARSAKVASRERHSDRAVARELLNAAADAALLSLSAKLNMTVKQTRAQLRSQCIAQPRLVIKFLTEAVAA
jgi:hypothetical protein